MTVTAFLTTRGGRDVVRPEAAFILGGRGTQIDFVDAPRVSFEACSPVRRFSSWRGKRNYDGFYWSSKNQGHVGFESLYERTALMVLDRESTVVAISSQPMWIFWPAESKTKFHAPDFFVRHANGDGEVVDVRPRERIDETAAASFEATRRLCEENGFRYRVVADLDRVLDTNLRFLSRYRMAAWQPAPSAVDLMKAMVVRPISVRALRASLAEYDDQSRALGWIYWYLWQGLAHANLRVPLSLDSVVGTNPSDSL